MSISTAIQSAACLLVLLGFSPAVADEVQSETSEAVSVPVETTGSVTIGGATVDYTAAAGTLPLLDETTGEARANVFFIAYTRQSDKPAAERPLTFCFNGGPGSSSVWLHMGAWGPRRVDMGDAGGLKPPPWRLVDNEASILDVTDLVFIDPVTTGYSRAAEEEDDGQFHGVDEDIESVAEFIRLYTTRYERWNSPKYLAGESYGTTRAAGLAGHLQRRHGMFLNGIILVSSILDFQTARFDRGNDLPHVLFLPTMTATAHYHGQLDAASQQRDLGELLREVELFAINEFSVALMRGDDLPEPEREQMARRLAQYTGLDPSFIEASNLRIGMSRFCKSLLRDQRKTVGRLDSRFTGIDADAAGDRYEYDSSYAAIQGPFTAALNDYVRRDLGYESDLPYEILTGRVQPWNYDRYRNRYLNVSDTLRRAMNRNPSLRVFVASGYYDFATPYFATDYTMNHLGLEPGDRDRITTRYYESGHMMYIHDASRAKLRDELAAFYRD